MTAPDLEYTALAASSPDKRFLRNLKVLHQVCQEMSGATSKDFSPAAIGRITELRGGPSLNTLYSPKGSKFRKLMSAWADACGTRETRKQKKVDPDKDGELLARIDDLVVRSHIGPLLAERRRLLEEVKTLRTISQGSPVIDFRPNVAQNTLEVLHPSSRLTTDETESLRNLCTPAWLEARGLGEGPRGELISTETGKVLAQRGTLPGIRKLII